MLTSPILRMSVPAMLLLFSYQSVESPAVQISALDSQREAVITIQDKTAVAIQRYITSNLEMLEDVRKKGKSTFRMMDKILRRYDLPIELKYLAVIESELNPKALSRVGAAGTWQLMPETAKILGLTINESIDERLDPAKSTKAAAIYLRDLYTEFGDWELVLAAYNCGPGPVYTAMHKSGSKNFWLLQRYLPTESREHVHRFKATYQYFEGENASFAYRQ